MLVFVRESEMESRLERGPASRRGGSVQHLGLSTREGPRTAEAPAESTDSIERVRIERIAMIATWTVLAAIIALTVTGDAGIACEAGAITAISLASAIHTAKFLFGFGGGFMERFPSDKPPEHAAKQFSVREYAKETLRLVAILAALTLLVGLLKLPSLLLHH
jgi:hypothetical protein